MDHAVLALGVVALVAVVVPVGELEIFLEGLHVAVLEEVAGLLPAEDVVGGAAPGGALEVEVALEELEEEGREVELPGFLGVLEDLLEELLAVVAVQEVVLVRRFFVDVAGGEHHAFDAEVHGGVEEVADVGGVDAGEEGGVGGDAEPALDGFLDGFHGDVVGAVAADGGVMLVLQAVEVDGEGEVFGGLEEIELALEEQGVGAEIDVLFAGHEAVDDFVDLGVDQRFAARDADHGGAAFLDGVEALLRGEALVEDVIRVLDLAAAGAGEVAAEERFEHQNERVTLAALQLLRNDVGGDRPGLGYWNHRVGWVVGHVTKTGWDVKKPLPCRSYRD
jgi:hypothetical protein